MSFRSTVALALLLLATASSAVRFPVGSKSARHYSPFCTRQPKLVCVLRPTSGNRVIGVLEFTNVANRSFRYWSWGRRCNVQVRGSVRRLKPGQHGMHIHAYGDETISTGSSLGGHFLNPYFIPVPHGLPTDRRRHWGDLGNIVADARGTAGVNIIDRVISLRGIVGRGIVVHAGQDMGAAAQPSGGSGPRVATCVIGFANPEKK